MVIRNHSSLPGAEFGHLLADLFRRAGWKVQRPRIIRALDLDLIAQGKGKSYAVLMKSSSEGRRDRLIPLLSQAIIEAQAIAKRSPELGSPLAVVAAPRVPPSVADQIKQFAQRYAPKVAIGIIDKEGLRAFVGPGLEILDARPARLRVSQVTAKTRLPRLFSDLNQWMLKILLAQSLPESLVCAPRVQFRNASQLAEAANVSVMTAFRFISQLSSAGFLDNRGEYLQIVRTEELFARWVSANREAALDVPVRWIIKQDLSRLQSAVTEYASEISAAISQRAKVPRGRVVRVPPRCCLGLFAAADALGLGFVHGVPPHLYLERLDLDVLRRLGLTTYEPVHSADAYIRIPSNREAVFRAAVTQGGLPISDVLQVWLDVSTHTARGEKQADQIRRRVLAPLFGKSR
ncbi:MAG: hypothetical protein U0V70_15595 [Terriglobia bacterium]